MKRLILAALLLAFATAASAQYADKPLLSKDRASLAVGLDYAAWSNPYSGPLTAYRKEWEASVYGAYVLTPRFTLAGSASYLVDSRVIRYRIGVRTVIWKGRD